MHKEFKKNKIVKDIKPLRKLEEVTLRHQSNDVWL